MLSYSLVFHLVLVCNAADSWAKVVFVLQNVTYKFDGKHVKGSISFSDKNSGNITMEFFQRVENADVVMEIRTTTDNELNYRLTFKRSLNLCGLLSNPGREKIARIFYLEIMRKGNWSDKCPIEGGVYGSTNLQVLPEMFPPILLNVKFRIDMNFVYFVPEKFTGLQVKVFGKLENKN